MAKLIADMSMSLDGFVADENDGIDEVFAWMGLEENAKTIEESTSGVGAVLTGRRTSDLANHWGGDHPVGVPTYVVSHRPPPGERDPETWTVHFVDDLEQAVRLAKDSAGEGWVGVAGGDTVRQLLALGLLDERSTSPSLRFSSAKVCSTSRTSTTHPSSSTAPASPTVLVSQSCVTG